MSRFAAGVLASLLGLGLTVGDTSPARALDAATATVTSSPNPAVIASPVTFTARVTTTAGGPPTGTVTFRVDGTDRSTGTLATQAGGRTIAMGNSHACALTAAGGVACWGYNGRGQLGDGTTTSRSTPVAVFGLASGVVALGAGPEYSCALTDAGAVKCWGANNFGQLGDGTTEERHTPVTVGGLDGGASAIGIGQYHACAVVGGGVRCWGLNGGRLGNGSTDDSLVPVAAIGLTTDVVAISAAYDHSCALTATGAVKCWGNNDNGQLGDDGGGGWRTASDVAGLSSGVAAISAGEFYTCALTDGGAVKCWGRNMYGELGIGSTETRMTPTDLPTLTSGVRDIGAGLGYACAVMNTGAAKCWGANGDGRLGSGSTASSTTPVAVSGATDMLTIAVNSGTCALRTTGGAKCWGDDAAGQLGDGDATTGGSLVPVDVFGLTGMVRSAATWTTSDLSKGDHAVVVAYSGDAGHDAATSSALTQTIDGKPSTTTLTTSKTPTKVGETVTFTTSVSASDGNPAGSVTLTVDGVDKATATLIWGSYAFDVTDLPAGPHTIGVRYGGDDTYAVSLAPTLTQTVDKIATTTTLTRSAATIRAGAGVTLTATVGSTSGSPDGGSVVFRDGTTVLATVAVSGGSAVHATNGLTVGIHRLTAAFQGTSDLTASTSAPVTVTVDARAGAQFRANTRTTGSQQYPAVAALSGGGWVVTWASKDQDGSSWGVYAQRYAANGSKAGGEFRVNTGTADSQSFPAIAATPDGGFVVAWLGTTSTGKSTGIRAQRFSAAGARLGTEFRVDTTAGTNQTAPSIAAAPGGGFLITWISNNASGTTFDVHAQLYDKTAKRVGGEVKANAVTMPAITSASSVAARSDGSWVVTWTSVAEVGAKPVVKAQRLTTTGARSGGEIVVTGATWAQSEPVVAGLDRDGFVVVWVSQGQDGSGKGLYAQRYTSAGVKLGTTFRVTLATAGDQSEPSVVTRLRTGFLVTWTSPDGSGKGIYCRLYGSNGVPFDAVIPVNTTTANDQKQSAVTMLGSAAFVVVWTSASDGGAEGVYGQRFEFADQ